MQDGVANKLRGWLSGLLGRVRKTEPAEPAGPSDHHKPFIRRRWNTTELQFAHGVSQSRMLTFAPDRLLIDYTRTMLGALVLVPDPRSIGMVGLGGGSQAKFCYRHLPDARIEVMENNPHVVALRARFRIPEDDTRFHVVLGDAAQLMRERHGRYDLLLVDGYDETGIPAALSSQQFYDDCRSALVQGGVMAINLYCDDADRHVERLRKSFGRRHVLVLKEARQSNRVALAWVGTPAPAGTPVVLPRAAQEQLEVAFERVRQGMATRNERGSTQD